MKGLNNISVSHSIRENQNERINNTSVSPSIQENQTEGKTVRIRIGENVLQCKVTCLESVTVLELKQKMFQRDLENGKQVRFIFRGRILQDHLPLSMFQIEENSIIQCVISNYANSVQDSLNQRSIPESSSPFNGIATLYIMCGTILCFLWSLYFTQGVIYFNMMSVFMLASITVVFLSFALSFSSPIHRNQ